jgi:hypothetical protein
MDESERLQRFRQHRFDDDKEFANRIMLLLNDPKIDKHCMVDAYYYDFSVIPKGVQEILQLWRDVYLIYGINEDGEIISKWVDRWDLDSSDPIVDGKVQHKPFDPTKNYMIPSLVTQSFNPSLLSAPTPDFIKEFHKNLENEMAKDDPNSGNWIKNE